jgi:hypothetical protein
VQAARYAPIPGGLAIRVTARELLISCVSEEAGTVNATYPYLE